MKYIWVPFMCLKPLQIAGMSYLPVISPLAIYLCLYPLTALRRKQIRLSESGYLSINSCNQIRNIVN